MKPIHAKPSLYAYYFEVLKKIALKYGYNLVLHGSLNRDLDLIAIPWEKDLGDCDVMINEFAEHLGGEVMQQSEASKHCFPHGRMSYVVNLNRSGKWNNYQDAQYYLDISVIPPNKNNF
ncbi:hypothetical protein [Adhaeribacter aquaticus]|uniref:hypothetical protein n=1 Tax=Adhaeribacter aquaticus TaxID=299567 RepID=UPI0003FADB6E|nr:hypothetical protein [Adhaeribacter aquaticus]